jgi:hypothetical protein
MQKIQLPDADLSLSLQQGSLQGHGLVLFQK